MHGYPSLQLEYIPVTNEAAGLLTTLVRPSHIVIYAPRDSLTCRLPAISLNLSINMGSTHADSSKAERHNNELTLKNRLWRCDSPRNQRAKEPYLGRGVDRLGKSDP
ncbi:hypothetical protein C9426_12470 [Serratia sp. S1B]|nr:hypothetical protein C9426_12470 [Serratia sp. S1B]